MHVVRLQHEISPEFAGPYIGADHERPLNVTMVPSSRSTAAQKVGVGQDRDTWIVPPETDPKMAVGDAHE
jgi:hypothetical protein